MPTSTCAEHHGSSILLTEPVLDLQTALFLDLQLNRFLIDLNARQSGCRGFRHPHRHGSVGLSPRLLALP